MADCITLAEIDQRIVDVVDERQRLLVQVQSLADAITRLDAAEATLQSLRAFILHKQLPPADSVEHVSE